VLVGPGRTPRNRNVRILATDIDPNMVIKTARAGVYSGEAV
jgi:chemotaxis methyl-accepting protein methylase